MQHYLSLENAKLDSDTYLSYFAYCLLQGKVFKMPSKLKFEAERVLGGTDLTSKVTRLLQALRQKLDGGIDSHAKLAQVWEEHDPMWLKDQLQAWFNDQITWPPMLL